MHITFLNKDLEFLYKQRVQSLWSEPINGNTHANKYSWNVEKINRRHRKFTNRSEENENSTNYYCEKAWKDEYWPYSVLMLKLYYK